MIHIQSLRSAIFRIRITSQQIPGQETDEKKDRQLKMVGQVQKITFVFLWLFATFFPTPMTKTLKKCVSDYI